MCTNIKKRGKVILPAKIQWLLKLPEIIQQLEALDAPVIDRACVEELFGVGRRRAIQLMHEFGGYQSGRTFLVDRQHLIGLLGAQAAGDEYEYERRRRKRLSEKLADLGTQAKGARITVPVETRIFAEHAADTPSWRGAWSRDAHDTVRPH